MDAPDNNSRPKHHDRAGRVEIIARRHREKIYAIAALGNLTKNESPIGLHRRGVNIGGEARERGRLLRLQGTSHVAEFFAEVLFARVRSRVALYSNMPADIYARTDHDLDILDI